MTNDVITDCDADCVYKQDQLSFVSNHSGTSPFEVCAVIFPSVAGCLLVQVLNTSQFSWTKHLVFQFQYEFFFQIFTQILVLTVLPAYTIHISCFMLLLSGILILFRMKFTSTPENAQDAADPMVYLLAPPQSSHYAFITNARVVVFIATAICILAVDFQIFPRRFAKAENYGFGVMDIGVGAFVLSNAVVSKEARNIHLQKTDRAYGLKKSITSSAPIIVLGIARILATRSVNYHEHISEYGRHWNFFFTLAVVKVLSSLIFLHMPASCSGALAFLIGFGYQFFLSSGLTEWILFGSQGDGSRDGLLNANREGVTSIWGYLSLYMAGVQMGRFFCRYNRGLFSWLWRLPYMCLFLVLAAWSVYLSHTFLQPVSRRFANLTYILWTVTFYTIFVVLFLIIDLLVVLYQYVWKTTEKPVYPRPSLITESVNYNTLLCFLMANLMTGFINLSFKTIYASRLEGLIIIISYMLILTICMVILYLKQLQCRVR